MDEEKGITVIPQKCPKCGHIIEGVSLSCDNCGEPIVPIIAEKINKKS